MREGEVVRMRERENEDIERERVMREEEMRTTNEGK